MRRFRKSVLTAVIFVILLVTLAVFISASDFDVAKSYFTSSGQSEAFFEDKTADSSVTRGEAAQFLEDFVKKSVANGIITAKNAEKSFTDGSTAITTVYRYGVMLEKYGTKFGASDKASYAEYLSAWLCVLGYSSEKGDFLYEFPYDCASQAGIISEADSGELTFAQMIDVAIRALGANFKSKSFSLVETAEHGSALAKLSSAAENSPFTGSLDQNTLVSSGNICGDRAEADHRISISVSRGNDTLTLPSYKIKAITATGDTSSDQISSGKRFCAFNFSGAITINVTLNNDVFSYDIYSTSANYSHAFSEETLSISVAKAQNIRVVFNSNEEQEIFIFAGAMGTTLTESTVKSTKVSANHASAEVESYLDGKVYINGHMAELDRGAYFSSAYGTLVCADALCEYMGLDRAQCHIGGSVYIDGVEYVPADAVNELLGFDRCIVDNTTKSIKYVYSSYSFDFDGLELYSASNANLSLTNDNDGNYKLSQKKSGFGGLIANVTEAYGLSDGSLDISFDAFASDVTKIKATLVSRGEFDTCSSASFTLTDDLRRCSYVFEPDEFINTENTEIYLIISPDDTSYPTGLDYTVAGNTITREEFYSQTQLVIYPEYPEKVNRIFDYKVTVTQGDRTEQLPVYNHTMWYVLGNRTVGGDSYRRFSAFAFSGEQVRVDIKVSCDVDCYSVMPSALGLKSTFKDGVISVYLDKPEYFLVRLNNRDTSIISVFADYPEFHADIPCREDDNVIWIDGWYEPTADQNVVSNGKAVPSTLEISEPNTVLYIAPGAVLNARTKIASTAKNTKVIGRGAIVDPYENIYKTVTTQGGNEGSGYRPIASSADGLYIDGITVIDSRSFNITIGGSNIVIKNVKELASMMTSDGISLYSGSNHRVEHCFIYVGDNAFVYSAKGSYIKDCIIGTTCAAFFPQGSTYSVTFEDCHVFASYGGLINNRYNGSDSTPVENRKDMVHTNTFINLDATDCVFLSWFFQGRNMGDLPKNFTFNGVSIPECTGTDNIHSTSGNYEIKLENSSTMLYTENYTLNMHNLYVGGKAILSRDQIDVQVTKASSDKVASNTLIFTNDGKYTPVKQHNVKVNYTLPDKVYVGSMLALFEGEVVRIGGELAMPADEIVQILRTNKTPATTQHGGKTYIKASALVSSGAAKAATEKNGSLYITPVYNGENLLLPDVGEVSRYTESPSYQVDLLTEKDSDGDWIYVMQPNPNSPNLGAGIARFITDDVKMYGAGTYTLTFKVKASVEGKFKTSMYYDDEDTKCTAFKIHENVVTTQWQTYSLDFEITDEIVMGDMIIFKFFSSGTILDRVFFTDIELTKK